MCMLEQRNFDSERENKTKSKHIQKYESFIYVKEKHILRYKNKLFGEQDTLKKF